MKLNPPEGTKYMRFITAFDRPLVMYIRNENDAVMYNAIKDTIDQFTIYSFAEWCSKRNVSLELIKGMTNEQIREYVDNYNLRRMY